MTKERRLPVIELFGPTIQGEGFLLGHPTHFLRLGGCGYRCTWCDSMHAVDPKLIKINRVMMSFAEILSGVNALPAAPWLTLTGGDPCLHDELEDLVHELQYSKLFMRVAVETQGELWPQWLANADCVTLSPKGPSSGNITSITTFANDLFKFRGASRGYIAVKVVVKDEADLYYARSILKNCSPGNQAPPFDKFYFQVCSPLNSEIPPFPEMSEEEKVGFTQSIQEGMRASWKQQEILRRYRWLVEELLRIPLPSNVAITPQTHTLLWPLEERGR